ncbi:MAG: DUF898 family protein [Rickettsiales bacterium]|nr:DUF898 family protein [Rickettsiales bacterium]
MLGKIKDSDNLEYRGKLGRIYLIWLKNIFLQLITLMIYRPWAKTVLRKYIFGNITIFGDRLEYSGTGRELFIGMLKAFLIIAVFPAILGLVLMITNPESALSIDIYVQIFTYFLVVLLLFYAKYASLKYRLSRTRWRGIKSGLGGNAQKYVSIRVLRGLLDIVCLNITGATSTLVARRYLINNIYIGNQRAKFTGHPRALTSTHVKTLLLAPFTLTLSRIWYHVALRNYTWNSIKVGNVSFLGTFKPWPTFRLLYGNLFILLFTLGFGMPICIQRSVKFLTNNVKVIGNDDDAELLQNTQNSDATGDGVDEIAGELGLDLDFSIW